MIWLISCNQHEQDQLCEEWRYVNNVVNLDFENLKQVIQESGDRKEDVKNFQKLWHEKNCIFDSINHCNSLHLQEFWSTDKVDSLVFWVSNSGNKDIFQSKVDSLLVANSKAETWFSRRENERNRQKAFLQLTEAYFYWSTHQYTLEDLILD